MKMYDEGKRSDCNITPFSHLKLRRRITYEQHKSEINVGGDWGTSHVCDGDIVIFQVSQRGTRTRGGTGTRVTAMDV